MTHNEQDVERVARAIAPYIDNEYQIDAVKLEAAKAALSAMPNTSNLEQAAKGLREALLAVASKYDNETDMALDFDENAAGLVFQALAQYDKLVKG